VRIRQANPEPAVKHLSPAKKVDADLSLEKDRSADIAEED
jgi:hypothetical protein